MDTVIRCRALTKRYGGKAALERLDLEVPKGAICALLGDNGAGKSTAMRMLTGQEQPDEGRAEILGEDAWHAAPRLRHRVGYVPEKPRFYDWMTVAEIGGFAAGFHRAGYKERFTDLAGEFALDRRARLKSLSKGGYAKVGLALALASDPEVLLLDEPTSGIDLFTRREFLSRMVGLAGEGKTVLISSHGIAEVERVASHAAFLAKGRLLLSGAMDELRHRLVRVKVRHDGRAPFASALGNVLEVENEGREWQASVLDLVPSRLEEVRHAPGVLAAESGPLSLEEMYTALLAREHRRGEKPARRERAHAAQEEPA